MELSRIQYEDLVKTALREDLGRAGDVTTNSIVPADQLGAARLLTRGAGCVAGLDVAALAFQVLDPELRFERLVSDGDAVAAGETLARMKGKARALLSAERTALNFLGRLSGIASATRAIVEKLAGHRTRIACTRKTTPGLRTLEKYAVRVGGGTNHRFGLDDAVLVKDNHLSLAGGIADAVERVRNHVGHLMKVEVEVDTLEQLVEALTQPIDAVLLDNMSPEQVSKAVRMVNGRLLTEVSGGITPENAWAYAEAGVDVISLGWITHSAPVLDVSLEIDAISES
jgi:nicotinate-nucleotide pyrophosphorylase (carboxylating)